MARPYKILRDLLRQNEITSDILAEELNVAETTISRKMNAHNEWTLDQMYHILDLIGEKPERMHIIFPRNGQNEPTTKRRVFRRAV